MGVFYYSFVNFDLVMKLSNYMVIYVLLCIFTGICVSFNDDLRSITYR